MFIYFRVLTYKLKYNYNILITTLTYDIERLVGKLE